MISRIILDRGHGLSNTKPGVFDPGATSAFASESSIATLVVGGALALLREAGVEVLLTPELPLSGVTKFVNERYKPGDLLIAVHLNAADSSTANGVETVFHSKAGDYRQEQANLLGRKFAHYVGIPFRRAIPDTETPAGASAGLAVLRDTKCPSLLLELGFVTNRLDVDLLEYGGGKALANAILELIDYERSRR